MTPDAIRQRCLAAGLDVLRADVVGGQVRVVVKKVPSSADGLQALMERLGVTSMTVGYGDGTGGVALWFMAGDEGKGTT